MAAASSQQTSITTEHTETHIKDQRATVTQSQTSQPSPLIDGRASIDNATLPLAQPTSRQIAGAFADVGDGAREGIQGNQTLERAAESFWDKNPRVKKASIATIKISVLVPVFIYSFLKAYNFLANECYPHSLPRLSKNTQKTIAGIDAFVYLIGFVFFLTFYYGLLKKTGAWTGRGLSKLTLFCGCTQPTPPPREPDQGDGNPRREASAARAPGEEPPSCRESRPERHDQHQLPTRAPERDVELGQATPSPPSNRQPLLRKEGMPPRRSISVPSVAKYSLAYLVNPQAKKSHRTVVKSNFDGLRPH